MKVLICDDEIRTIDKCKEMLENIAKRASINLEILTYNRGELMLINYEEWINSVSIMYLDVDIKTMNGINLAKEARELGYKGEIIFLTISKEYVFDSFDVYPINYLLKNEMPDTKFEEVFLKGIKIIEENKGKNFICKSGKGQLIIPLKDIEYFEVQKKVITIYHGKEEGSSFYSKMDEVERKLDKNIFVRIHRSYLVNLRYVHRFSMKEVTLQSGVKLPIGRKYKYNAKEIFSSYIENQSLEFKLG